jgi:hypothetical protein
MIRFVKKLFVLRNEVQNGVLHRAYTTNYEDLCQ